MKGFVCEDCGKTFFYPKTIHDCVGEYWGVPAYEDWSACPYCNSTDIEEAEIEDTERNAEIFEAEREQREAEEMYECYVAGLY